MITKADLTNGVLAATDQAANDVWNNKAALLKQKQDNDAKLAALIKGSQLKDDSFNMERDRNLADATGLRTLLGKDANVAAGDVRFDPRMRDTVNAPIRLTPGQVASETVGAKKIADYDAAGGRAGAEQNIKQTGEVLSDLQNGKRDWWDRKVGGFLSGSPAFMGTFASAEKARRDKVRSTAIMMAKQSDPNPTQKQIDDIMGQIYDPSSSDEDNTARLLDYQNRIRNVNDQMEQSSRNLRTTGYVMPGLAGNPPLRNENMMRSPQTAPDDGEDPGTVDDAGAEAAYQDALKQQGRSTKQVQQVLQNKRTGQKKIIYTDGTSEIK